MKCDICEKEILKVTKIPLCSQCRNKCVRYQGKKKCAEYKGGQCEKCGYKKYIQALEFHHINSLEKEFQIGNNYHRSWEEICVELDKCLLLCANCHREEHLRLNENYDKYINFTSQIYKPVKKQHIPKPRLTKIPDKDTLIKLIWEKPSTQIAKEYEVSDTAICKWCKKYDIEKPPRGYWTKKLFAVDI